MSDDAVKKNHVKVWFIVLAAVVLLLAAAAFWALKTYRVIIFRHGIFLGDSESIVLQILPEELEKLEHFSQLKEADLRGSDCYREIYGWTLDHEEVKVLYDVPLPYGSSFDESTGEADLRGLSPAETAETADSCLAYMHGVKSLLISADSWTEEELLDFAASHAQYEINGSKVLDRLPLSTFAKLKDTCPLIEYSGSLGLGDHEILLHSDRADLSGIQPAELEEFESFLSYLPQITTVDFGTEGEGRESLTMACGFLKDHPELTVDYSFQAFGKIIGLCDETLDLNHIEMWDDGDEVRSIIQYMPRLKFLDMDSCGVDNESMASIRDDFPDIKVVWRIWFGRVYSVRTNVEKILASAPLDNGGSLTPDDTVALKYCTDLKYLDLGHNEDLTDISFCAYMPNLEVLIIPGDNIHDIWALENCTHLEFFEVFNNYITTLEPLRNCTELKHLNICSNQRVHDLSPIYGITGLERLWTGIYSGIPMYQIEEFQELVPDCEVCTYAVDPHDYWREDHPRYILLQEQMGYLEKDYAFYWKDPLYYPHD